jgi:AcrR family transcriptional regulator
VDGPGSSGLEHGLFGQGDLTTKARIRAAAMEVIAERGMARASVRAIADRAGVSAALVLHHYGSRQAVLDEVARWALQALHAMTERAARAAAATSAFAGATQQRQAAMDLLLAQVPHLGDYLRQLLLEPSPDSVRWFVAAVEATALDLGEREQQGRARPSSDVPATATMLVLLSMAPLLLQPFLDAALGTDVSAAEGRNRWRRSQAELLTSALYPSAKDDVADG